MRGRYLVGVDGSGQSDAALTWVLHRAGLEPAPIVLIHVRPDTDTDTAAAQTDPVVAPEARPLADVLRATREAHPELEVDAVELRGPVAPALAAFARPEDLLVVGTHRHAFSHDDAVECGSWKIVEASPCSVVVVPQVDVRLRSGVVVGIDHHRSGAELARIAASEANLYHDELLMVQSLPEATDRDGQQRSGLAIEDAVAAAHQASPTTVISSQVTRRPPAEALLHSARGKALLVIGESTTPGGEASLRSVLHDVLLNIPAPVLTVRGIAA